MTVEQATFGGATEIDDFADPDPVSTDSPDGGDDTQNTSGDGDFEPAPDDAPAEQPAEIAEAPAPVKPEPAAPAAPEFDADLLASVGMTADEAAAEFGSNAELARYDALLNRQLLQQARARAAAQQAQQQADTGEPAEGQQPDAPKPVQQPQTVQRPQPAGEEPQSPFAIDRERWDKDTLEHLVDPIQKWAIERDRENQDLRQTVQALRQHYENQLRQQYVAEFESAIEGLGDDWTPVLGKGTLHEITPETLKARQELDAAAQMLNQVRTANGLPALPLKRAVQAAASQAFPDRYREITRRTVSGQVLQRQGQYTARPSAKTTSGQTATERAVQAAEQFYEERGQPSSAPQSLGPDDF